MSAGFVWIIVFKCLKGALFILVGIAALRFMKVPEIPTAAKLAHSFRLSPENQIVRHAAALLVEARATPKKVGGLGALALFVGAIFLAEAALLVFRIWWSTYLMIGLTALGLPLEIFEILRQPDHVRRYVVLAINVAILIYLWRRRNEFRTSKR